MPMMLSDDDPPSRTQDSAPQSRCVDLVVRCQEWGWRCDLEIVCSRCPFFQACCNGGYQESTTNEISLDEDPPLAVQAMLRYLHTLDCNQIYRPNDPLFSDVERDLDVLVIADKYDLQELKAYMVRNLVLFYETDQRPPKDPKGWSVKNQEGFARILQKLSEPELDVADARAIRRAVADFIVRREKTVMKWDAVKIAVEHDALLSHEMIGALLTLKRRMEDKIEDLEETVLDLREELEEVEDAKEECEGEIENLQGFLSGQMHAYVDWEHNSRWDRWRYWEVDSEIDKIRLEEAQLDCIISQDHRSEPVHVEDYLSGITYVLGSDGPELPPWPVEFLP